jgi:hypothetical protein
MMIAGFLFKHVITMSVGTVKKKVLHAILKLIFGLVAKEILVNQFLA